MKKLGSDDCKICNTFNEYFEHLNKSGMEQGVTGIEDEDKLFILNVALAAALTISQHNESTDVEDYFA